jgi:hypothetical protein
VATTKETVGLIDYEMCRMFVGAKETVGIFDYLMV